MEYIEVKKSGNAKVNDGKILLWAGNDYEFRHWVRWDATKNTREWLSLRVFMSSRFSWLHGMLMVAITGQVKLIQSW